MIIRRINKQDVLENENKMKELIEITYRTNFQGNYNYNKIAIDTYNRLVSFIDDNTAILFGAFNENEILGFIWAHEREFMGEIRLHGALLVVDESIRHIGIGKELMLKMEEIARERNIKTIESLITSNNSKIVLFTEKLGYKCTRMQIEKEV